MHRLPRPSVKMPSVSRGLSTSWRLAWTVVPTQAHQTGTNTINARPTPGHEWSRCSNADTWVTAKTKTRSKNSSAQVTRFSDSAGTGPTVPSPAGCPRPLASRRCSRRAAPARSLNPAPSTRFAALSAPSSLLASARQSRRRRAAPARSLNPAPSTRFAALSAPSSLLAALVVSQHLGWLSKAALVSPDDAAPLPLAPSGPRLWRMAKAAGPEKVSFFGRLRQIAMGLTFTAKRDKLFVPLVVVAVLLPLIAGTLLVTFGGTWVWLVVSVLAALVLAMY